MTDLPLPDPPDAEPDMTLEQFLDGIVQVTVTVMTRMPEKKGEWWQALGKFYSQARRHRDIERAAFFDALCQLVEGVPPERLSARVSPAFYHHWQSVLAGIQSGSPLPRLSTAGGEGPGVRDETPR